MAQTFSGWELILVDDGSPDRSGEICDKHAAKDDRIKVIHKENGGVSRARNAGLQAAVGKADLTEKQEVAADMNGDGKVDSADARTILQRAVGSE